MVNLVHIYLSRWCSRTLAEEDIFCHNIIIFSHMAPSCQGDQDSSHFILPGVVKESCVRKTYIFRHNFQGVVREPWPGS